MQNNISFEVFNPVDSPVLILCDHASNAVPACVNDGSLGISDQDMQRHIAFDIGAKAVAEILAKMLNATLLASKFSRLVIDPNRHEDDPTILMKIYDGTVIPGNRYAGTAERERRLEIFYRPYHAKITAQINAILSRGQTPVIIAVHSFTPKLQNRPERPWHIGVLWDQDGRIPIPLMEKLGTLADVCLGNNEPYSGALRGDTMYCHAAQRDLPHVLIELRNDLIKTSKGQKHWAGILAKALGETIQQLETS